MSRLSLLAALMAAASLPGHDAHSAPDVARTSAPRGPGMPAQSWWNRATPLSKPASQAKRRRKARRNRRAK